MKIGIDRMLWTNDDMPELGDEVTAEQCVKEAHAAGYQGIEMGRKFPKDAESMKALLNPYQCNWCLVGWMDTSHKEVLKRSLKHLMRI